MGFFHKIDNNSAIKKILERENLEESVLGDVYKVLAVHKYVLNSE